MADDLERPMIGVTYDSAELDEFLLWRHMFRGVVAAGGTPVAIDCNLPVPHMLALVERLDGLILSGGGDVDPRRYGGDPADPLLRGVNTSRDDAETTALAAARLGKVPVLAICRGVQLVNVALGGTLYADLSRDYCKDLEHRLTGEALDTPLHEVEVVAASDLAVDLGQAGVISVNSQHHQGIRDLAPVLTPNAFSADGLIEGFEIAGESLIGVQWHPEVLWPTAGHALDLLASFVAKCTPKIPTHLEGACNK